MAVAKVHEDCGPFPEPTYRNESQPEVGVCASNLRNGEGESGGSLGLAGPPA